MTHKILIVDDSRLARMAVLRALDSLAGDWTRLEASDAAIALDIVRRETPDIALIDFNMPGKDGLTLAAELRTINPRIHTAVISANHQLEVVERARAAGAAFLRKPITEASLKQFLDTLPGRAQDSP